MPLDQITNFAEIVASVATVSTLVYLAIQLRKSNAMQTAESRRATINSASPLASIIGESDAALEVFYKGMTEYSALSPQQKLRFRFLFSMLVSQNELMFTDSSLGLIEWEVFECDVPHHLEMLNTEGGRSYWKKLALSHAPKYRKYINDRLEK
jgi:hypothetical protein